MSIKEKAVKSIQFRILTNQNILNDNMNFMTNHYAQFFVQKSDLIYKATRIVEYLKDDLEILEHTSEEKILEQLEMECEGHLNQLVNGRVLAESTNHLFNLSQIYEVEVNRTLYSFYFKLIEILKRDS